MEPTSSVLDKLEQKRQADAEVTKRVRQYALDQGLVMVEIGPRTFSVVRIDNSGSMRSRGTALDHADEFFTYISGTEVFRGTWNKCRVYIEDNATPLPEDLLPEGVRK